MSRVPNDALPKLKRLMEVAQKKTFARDLLLNGYNPSRFSVDMTSLLRYTRYAAGQNELMDGITYFQSLVTKGIETQEITGEEYVNDLLKWYDRQYNTKWAS